MNKVKTVKVPVVRFIKGLETHLFDVPLTTNIWAMDMYVPTPPMREDLHIIYTSKPRYSPVEVVLAKKGSCPYVVVSGGANPRVNGEYQNFAS